MLTVTERAEAELQELLVINDASPDEGVKLVPSGTGSIGMTIGRPSEDDAVIDRDGKPLLIVDIRLAQVLDGAEIDCAPTAGNGQQATEFTLRPPQ